ncbi:MAG: hypothetical protein UZ06_CHB003002132 [Chlorobi bacterium OLB6]|nr:MAG: hypothetical protein UZ06_CHB003002132 [Chlorobi bacterium OLB6]
MQRVVSLILGAVIAICTTSVTSAQLMYEGEELVYRVSYLNITLGTIKTVTEPFTMLDGRRVAKVKVFIDSHPNIPFVSLHSVYESWIDTSITYSHKFNANTLVDDKVWEFDQYLFDYGSKKLTMEKYRNKEKIKSDIVDLPKKYNDGSSLLFAARALLYSGKSFSIPTAIMGNTVSTVINFSGKKQLTEINAVDYPIRTVYLNGDANWTGVYGLTGRFEGWFSDDEARVPIRAKMKVYVGSVTIELKQWKRGSWKPPVGKK